MCHVRSSIIDYIYHVLKIAMIRYVRIRNHNHVVPVDECGMVKCIYVILWFSVVFVRLG